jgi:hypothetical protein
MNLMEMEFMVFLGLIVDDPILYGSLRGHHRWRIVG